MKAMILTEIGWETTNEALANSLPKIIVIAGAEESWDNLEISDFLEESIGIRPNGFVVNDPVNKASHAWIIWL